MESPTRTMPVEELLFHAEWLRALATRLCHDGDGDDAVQDAYLAALRSPPRAQGENARPWLAEVVRNLARRRWRTRGVHARGQTTLEQLHEGSAAPADELLERAQLQRLLADLVVQLEEPFRSVVLLRYYEGKSSADIARQLGIPAGTVRWRLSEGIDRLRARLDGSHGGKRDAWRALLLPICLPRGHTVAGAAASGGPISAALKSKGGVLGAGVVGLAALVLVLGAALGPSGGGGKARDPRELAAARPALVAEVALDAAARPARSGIEGIVRDPGGAPVAGAVVVLARGALGAESRSWVTPVGVARTDAEGGFVFADAWPGSYRLTASAEAGSAAVSPVFTVSAGRRPHVELTLRAGGHVLAGQVLDEGGGPVPRARVTAFLGYPWNATGVEQPRRLYQTVADDEGRYRMRLEPREYTVRFAADGYAPATTSVPLTRAVTRDMRLQPAAQIAGRVVDRTSGAPVPGASVQLHPLDQRSLAEAALATADDGWRFLIADATAGTYQVLAQDPGRNLTGAGPTVIAIAAAAVHGLEIVVDRAAAVSGRVEDDQGMGVAGITVAAVPSEFAPLVPGRAVTDAKGAFTVGGMLPGRYRVIARGSEGQHAGTVVSVGPQGAAAVVLRFEPDVLKSAVTGRVVRPDGQAAEGVLVRIDPVSQLGRSVATTESAADGGFVLKGVDAEAMLLTAWHPAHGVATLPLSATTEPGDGRRNLEVRLTAGATIAGRVTFDDGRPAAGVSIAATRQEGTVVYDSATSDDDGRFAIANLAHGRYSVLATRKRGPQNRWTSRETPSLKIVNLAAGERKSDLALVLARGGKHIAGTVLLPDGTPAAGVQVIAAEEVNGQASRPREWEIEHRATSREDGSFHIGDVEVGTFTLFAARPDHPETEVKGVVADRSDVRIELRAAASLGGVVVRADGRPATGFSVIVVPRAAPDETSPDKFRRMQVSQRAPVRVQDPSGAFAVGGLLPASYDVKISDGIGGGVSASVTLGAGEKNHGLRLTISPGVTARGRVVRHETGEPLAGVGIAGDLTGRWVHALSGPDGFFELPGLLPDEATQLAVRANDDNIVPEFVDVRVPGGAPTLELGNIRLVAGDYRAVMRERGRSGLRFKKIEGAWALEVNPGSPAARAGLVTGDRLLAVERQPVKELGQSAINYLSSRKAGEKVDLTVQSAAGGEPRVVTVVADEAGRK